MFRSLTKFFFSFFLDQNSPLIPPVDIVELGSGISEETRKREALKEFRQTEKLFVECLTKNDQDGAAKHSRKLIYLRGAVGEGTPDTEEKLLKYFLESVTTLKIRMSFMMDRSAKKKQRSIFPAGREGSDNGS